MNLLGKFRSGDRFGTRRLDEEDVEAVRETAAEHATDTPLLRVRPYVDAEGFGGGQPERYARSLHRGPETEAGERTVAHEVWFADRELSVRVSTPDPEGLRDTVDTLYPDSDVEKVDPAAAYLDAEAGEYAAAARLGPKADSAYPIRYPGCSQAYDADPSAPVLKTAVNPGDVRVLIQAVLTPVSERWFRRGKWGPTGSQLAEHREEGRVVGELDPEIVQSYTDKKAARDMYKQHGRPAFAVTLAVVAIGPTADGAAARVEAVADAFDEFDHDAAEQGLVAHPFHGESIRHELERTAARFNCRRGRLKRWVFGEKNVLTDRELGAVAHVPGREVDIPELDRTDTETGPGVPPDAPRHSADDPAAERGGDVL